MDKTGLRSEILFRYTNEPKEAEEILRYGAIKFDFMQSHSGEFPLPNEDFVSFWEHLSLPIVESMQKFMPQLHFPIQEGISQTENYKNCTRKGEAFPEWNIPLEEPENIELRMHQSAAGKLPVLIIRNRKDFVTLVQALTARNEPWPVPSSMGACMVNGYINWRRVAAYQEQWQKQHPNENWNDYFAEFSTHKSLYQDRFILLSDGSYSGVSADILGHSQEEWKELSLNIRLHHECTHYFTLRYLGSMQNNLFDEIIADFMGIRMALGYYSAKHFLTFLGLEKYPEYREGGRMQNYRGNPPISSEAFEILQKLVYNVAHQLEIYEQSLPKGPWSLEQQAEVILNLAKQSPEELAQPDWWH